LIKPLNRFLLIVRKTMFQKKPITIILISIFQMIVACYFFYLFYLGLLKKINYLMIIFFIMYSLNFLFSSLSLLRLENAGRISSLTLFGSLGLLSLITLSGFLGESVYVIIFCSITFLVTVCFIYYLLSPKIKDILRN
jgi:hypothetical protein